jgi:hypothetical protein
MGGIVGSLMADSINLPTFRTIAAAHSGQVHRKVIDYMNSVEEPEVPM